ncbi:hypothetical protein F750_6986 [Streptomyces sp. PAMC 26508]|nr:hypothetical protein F750_6986 [Streptomyces sp. PAMC 26508]
MPQPRSQSPPLPIGGASLAGHHFSHRISGWLTALPPDPRLLFGWPVPGPPASAD